jgi:hypothetical protein
MLPVLLVYVVRCRSFTIRYATAGSFAVEAAPLAAAPAPPVAAAALRRAFDAIMGNPADAAAAKVDVNR